MNHWEKPNYLSPKEKRIRKKRWIKGHSANLSVKINGKTGRWRWKTCWLILEKMELTNTFCAYFLLCLFIFAKYDFLHIWRVFIFANVVQKKISCVFSFPKSTKIREICKNMYTLKVVCLGYVWYCHLSIPVKGYRGVWTSS